RFPRPRSLASRGGSLGPGPCQPRRFPRLRALPGKTAPSTEVLPGEASLSTEDFARCDGALDPRILPGEAGPLPGPWALPGEASGSSVERVTEEASPCALAPRSLWRWGSDR